MLPLPFLPLPIFISPNALHGPFSSWTLIWVLLVQVVNDGGGVICALVTQQFLFVNAISRFACWQSSNLHFAVWSLVVLAIPGHRYLCWFKRPYGRKILLNAHLRCHLAMPESVKGVAAKVFWCPFGPSYPKSFPGVVVGVVFVFVFFFFFLCRFCKQRCWFSHFGRCQWFGVVWWSKLEGSLFVHWSLCWQVLILNFLVWGIENHDKGFGEIPFVRGVFSLQWVSCLTGVVRAFLRCLFVLGVLMCFVVQVIWWHVSRHLFQLLWLYISNMFWVVACGVVCFVFWAFDVPCFALLFLRVWALI